MVETKQETSAATVVIVMMLVVAIVYLILAPPSVVLPLLGNFSTTASNVSSLPMRSGVYQITSYVGGIENTSVSSFGFPSFVLYYLPVNYSFSISPFSLSSSIFGSGSYTIKFTGNTSDTYLLLVNVSSVSGAPYIAIYSNGQLLYKQVAVAGLLSLPITNVVNGQNVLSIYNELNGLALYQSFHVSEAKLVSTHYVNNSYTKSLSIPTFLGQGNFYLDFTPIGHGDLHVSVNGVNISSMNNVSDIPQNLTIPQSIIEKGLSAASVSSSQQVLNLPLSIDFSISTPGRYVVVNNAILYVVPPISEKSASVQYNIPIETGQYVLSLYVSSIIKAGSVTFTVYPSGASFSIPSTELRLGSNVLLEPASYFSSAAVSGNYTGTITISSNGLIVPTYLSIQKS